MNMLKDIIKGISNKKIIGCENVKISDITFDSKKVKKNSLFVAVCGTNVDGHKYISQAIENGASSILCSCLPSVILQEVTYILVDDTQKAMAYVAKSYFDNPSSKMKLVGITGTNGKTSTATLLYDLFTELGYKCGLISTINYVVCGEYRESSHTTPDIITLNNIFCEMIEKGCEYCFMEVSSHAISQHRVTGLEFDVALFTNITLDHLDYHKTFEAYIATKKGLFDLLTKSAMAIINTDDRNGKVMVQNSVAKVKTFSLKSASDYVCRVVEEHLDGMLLEIDNKELWVKFIGKFNAYNLLGIYATALELGVTSQEVLLGLSSLKPVSGRFETLALRDGSVAIVDYAHTPDALENVLGTIVQISKSGQKVICVVGCGGDRDKSKRPLMAKIAAEKSDFTIFTSDNPRTESPDDILEDMLKGVKGIEPSKYITISSRKQAIKMAVMIALQSPKSILLVAGKGHETYQEVNGIRAEFDDKKEILSNLV